MTIGSCAEKVLRSSDWWLRAYRLSQADKLVHNSSFLKERECWEWSSPDRIRFSCRLMDKMANRLHLRRCPTKSPQLRRSGSTEGSSSDHRCHPVTHKKAARKLVKITRIMQQRRSNSFSVEKGYGNFVSDDQTRRDRLPSTIIWLFKRRQNRREMKEQKRRAAEKRRKELLRMTVKCNVLFHNRLSSKCNNSLKHIIMLKKPYVYTNLRLLEQTLLLTLHDPLSSLAS